MSIKLPVFIGHIQGNHVVMRHAIYRGYIIPFMGVVEVACLMFSIELRNIDSYPKLMSARSLGEISLELSGHVVARLVPKSFNLTTTRRYMDYHVTITRTNTLLYGKVGFYWKRRKIKPTVIPIL